MKLRLLFLFFFVTLALPAIAAAQDNSTSTATTTQRSPRPACAITANPGAVYVGQSVTLRWSSQYATGGTITSLGSVGPSGSANVIPTASANAFQGTFTGPGGVGTCAVQISILQGSGAGFGGTGGASGGTTDGAPTQTQIRTGAGLIPCTGTDCQACHLAGLAQNIINWLVGFSIPLAALMFAYAGVIYFTAGQAGWLGKIDDAHKIFTSVGIGFLIVITAWLGIQTILKAVLAPGFYQSWNTIQCVRNDLRPTDKTVRDFIGLLPGLRTDVAQTVPPSANLNPSTGCIQGDYFQDGQCIGAFEEKYKPFSTANCDPVLGCFSSASGGGQTYGKRGWAQCASENTNCSVDELLALGLTPAQANTMSCIAITENSGQAVGCSGTGPCGTFQISKTNWGQYAPAGCRASNFGGNITAAQNNGECNKQTMAVMVQNRGYQPWTGNNPGQSPWNPAAITCADNYGSL